MLVVGCLCTTEWANITEFSYFSLFRELVYQQIGRYIDTSLHIKSHLDLSKTL